MAASRRAAGAARTAWRGSIPFSRPRPPSSRPPEFFPIPLQAEDKTMRLNGKIALVTAAASGLGRAGAARFVRDAARVAAIAISRAALAGLNAHSGADPVSTNVAALSSPDRPKRRVYGRQRGGEG